MAVEVWNGMRAGWEDRECQRNRKMRNDDFLPKEPLFHARGYE